MILIEIAGMKGDCLIEDSRFLCKCFTVESFGFGVAREVAESAKAGTYDLKMGVGELQECTLSKSMDLSSSVLARAAISGASIGDTKIYFVETGTDASGNQKILCYLMYILKNTFVKTWSTSGDGDSRPTEELALWYNSIAFAYGQTKDGVEIVTSSVKGVSWDHVRNKPDSEAEKVCENFLTSQKSGGGAAKP